MENMEYENINILDSEKSEKYRRNSSGKKLLIKKKPWRERRQERKEKRNTPPLWIREPDCCPHIVETFRSFANQIILFQEEKKVKTVMVTGADDKVGTSTIAFNLALIMSKGMPDRRVLIIDTNLERPSLHLAFNHTISNGLAEYLLGEKALGAVIQPTFLGNLDIIPFIPMNDEIMSPFSLPRFTQLLDEVRSYYDIIFLDSASALKSSHTKRVSSKVDGVVLVVEANRTRFEVLQELSHQLDAQGANVLGSFLNKRKYYVPQWIYRYLF
ncbi:MAG: tyrosine-protein kinase family protein [Candidatus Electrothrix sp. GM3_4]|nr:tyrosine-protein kinase family protein [Candidatus Electrothrix sp. GM3_4]